MTRSDAPALAAQIDWPSIDDAQPSEEGGPIARGGFSYQDEIAVGFLLEMIEDANLLKVHCETHDDLVLVRSAGPGTERIAEYAQVKAEEPDQLWTVATLCEKKKSPNSSLFERSLARDRHAETARFRIVTLRPPASALVPLTYPADSEFRVLDCEAMREIHEELDRRFPEAKSPKGNDSAYWLAHCHWDARYDLQTVAKDNQRRLFSLGNKAGCVLLIEQITTLLEDLRAMAKTASDLQWVPHRAKKIITREFILNWWSDKLREIAEGAAQKSGGKLADKLVAVGVSADIIGLAIELRRDYAALIRSPRYMESDEIRAFQGRVKSDALTLRTQLMSGALKLDGTQFHARCVEQMDAINASRPTGVPDHSAFLKGCLYDIADRCLLRFEPPAS
ncbi:dsDNA nuclease domain-containing protein [Azospirillum himalayense]|uniref:DsDNA nuclease domain-containing protein n=1 Tax=Azospirillum himalayense TaxID=654847 RepID=A0ABW0GAX4_9PROT